MENAYVRKWVPGPHVVVAQIILFGATVTSGDALIVNTFYGTCGGTLTEVTDGSVTIHHANTEPQSANFQIFHPASTYYFVVYTQNPGGNSAVDLSVITPPDPPLPSGSGWLGFQLDICDGEPIEPGVTFPLRRVRRFVLPFDRGLTVFLQRLEFLLQVGESDDSPVYVRLSKNGGETFGAWQTLTAGAFDEFSKRVFWNVNSSGRNWVGEFVVDAPYQWYLIDAFVDYEVGEN